MSTFQRSLAGSPELPAGLSRRRTPPMPAAGRLLVALLGRLDRGSLDVTLPDGSVRQFGRPESAVGEGRVPATLHLADWRVALDTLRRGDIGFGEAYIDGRWDTHDLIGLMTLLAANRTALERAFYGRGAVQWLLRLNHLLNANTRRQARRNVVAHYDLGNAFYRLWLDETMSYSSALFDGDPSRPLPLAQQAKYQRLLDQLGLPAGAHILELGCGWGGFAQVAAGAGYRVTGVSLSDAQTAYARTRIAQAGLGDRVEFRVEDYRDVRGHYDGIVSIEMFEAVGERWWPAFFRRLQDLLVPGGRAAIQTITIAEDRFARYRRETDFIQRHVFPGGMLASPCRLLEEAADGGLVCIDSRSFGDDYALTLRHWLEAFDARVDAVRALGFDERFIRCWRFYLAYCIAGFSTGSTDVGHYTFARC